MSIHINAKNIFLSIPLKYTLKYTFSGINKQILFQLPLTKTFYYEKKSCNDT